MTSYERKMLCSQTVHAQAPGKAILLGEHIVLYGHPAIALGLPDITLQVSLFANGDRYAHWHEAWSLTERGQVVQPSGDHCRQLTQAWAKALEVCGGESLDVYVPQSLVVNSLIPMGAGMGASAALSTALVRLASSVLKRPFQGVSSLSAAANAVDHVFHGTASGLDTAACSAEGLILFSKEKPLQNVVSVRPFWVVLVDSGVKSKTKDMVAQVAALRNAQANGGGGKPAMGVDAIMADLAHEVGRCVGFFAEGALKEVGLSLQKAQQCLGALGVSTPLLQDLCNDLCQCGALGAKVTGSGGGGLVLGLFDQDPVPFIKKSSDKIRSRQIYITKVGAS